MHLLQNPSSFRYAGWDLETLDTPRIVKGEYLEVRNDKRKIITLFEDGTLIAKTAADDTFLSWGSKRNGKGPYLNPVALIEFTYNFVNFYKDLLPHFDKKPKKFNFRVELNDAIRVDDQNSKHEEKLGLVPYGINAYSWRWGLDLQDAPESNMKKDIDATVEELENFMPYVVYKIIEKVYLWFGLSSEKIPYISQDNKGDRFIDIEQIKKIKD